MSYRRTPSFQLTPVTGIIGICVLLFIASFITPINYWLGLIPGRIIVQPGTIYTLFTSIFLHAGWYHIFFNMFALYFLGSYLKQFIGDRKMLIIFLGGGIAGSCLFFLIALTPLGDINSRVVGASGGIFALAGAVAVLSPNTRVLLFFFFPMPMRTAVVVLFFVSMLLSFNRATGSFSVAWEAHLGGLILGVAAGYYFKRRLRQNYWW